MDDTERGQFGWLAIATGLAVTLALTVAAHRTFQPEGWAWTSSQLSEAAGEGVAVVSAAELYQEFICSCCGKDIGSCQCGLAKERRAVVDSLLAQGRPLSEIYRVMFQHYGAGIFFDQELAGQVRAGLAAQLPRERPILVIEPDTVDLGTVPVTDEPVSTAFHIQNAGEQDLTITGIKTSCMCTTAYLESEEGTSPTFGAHDNPTGWSVKLPPGAEAKLVVTFDPAAHGPKGVGQFRRVISIYSDDPLDSQVNVEVAVEVTD
ncbi:MAG: DUF1573 domain-containing protein [Anaerolineae bacterium]